LILFTQLSSGRSGEGEVSELSLTRKGVEARRFNCVGRRVRNVGAVILSVCVR
jgi:hypothetical protein